MENAIIDFNSEIMKKYKKSTEFLNKKIKDWVIAIACLSFFPLLYLMGRTIKLWLE